MIVIAAATLYQTKLAGLRSSVVGVHHLYDGLKSQEQLSNWLIFTVASIYTTQCSL